MPRATQQKANQAAEEECRSLLDVEHRLDRLEERLKELKGREKAVAVVEQRKARKGQAPKVGRKGR